MTDPITLGRSGRSFKGLILIIVLLTHIYGGYYRSNPPPPPPPFPPLQKQKKTIYLIKFLITITFSYFYDGNSDTILLLVLYVYKCNDECLRRYLHQYQGHSKICTHMFKTGLSNPCIVNKTSNLLCEFPKPWL